jgi:hypothetical protein
MRALVSNPKIAVADEMRTFLRTDGADAAKSRPSSPSGHPAASIAISASGTNKPSRYGVNT